MSDSSARAAAQSIVKHCLATRSRQLDRKITRLYDAALRDSGLKSTQLSVLACIAAWGSLSPSRLGQMLDLDKSTVSRNLERLKYQGWIMTEIDEDARSDVLTITSDGGKVLAKAHRAWKRAQREVKSVVGETVAEALATLEIR